MSFSDYKKIIHAAKKMRVFQIALGGGNPNQHPDFVNFLHYTATNEIVPNYTTNGRGLTKDILEATEKYCGAVAVSAYAPYEETSHAIELLVTSNIKTNIHFILDAKSIETAIQWLQQPPDFIKKINALIFLNYKPSGRKIYENLMLRNSHRLQEFFELATSNKTAFKIGFDACCVSGVFHRTNANPKVVDACDAGRFSLFISEDMKAYPCSFQREFHEGETITSKNSLHDIWMHSSNFDSFRKYFSSDRCTGCSSQSNCKNGCPIFDDLVVCGRR